MLDERFYVLQPAPSLRDLAVAGQAELVREGEKANSLASLLSAKKGDLTFIESEKGLETSTIAASVCFAPIGFADKLPPSISVLESKSPRWGFAQAAELIAKPRKFQKSSGLISGSASIETGAEIGPNVVLGDDVSIGSGTTIGAGSVIWPGVKIGRNCVIGSNVTIKCAYIGDRVKVYSGVVIGEAGFGLSVGPAGADDTPHFGRVIVQDKVTIGANSCIDRGAFTDTLIGENVKIDNLCHISHNVRLEAHSVLAAFCGIAGSTVIGTGTQMGGNCSVSDHLVVGKGVKLAGNSGVMSDVPDGETWGGYPAKPIKTWLRQNVWLAKQVENRKKT